MCYHLPGYKKPLYFTNSAKVFQLSKQFRLVHISIYSNNASIDLLSLSCIFFSYERAILYERGNPLQCKDSCGSRSECSVFYRTFWRGAAERPVSLPALTAATVPSHLAETPMVLPRANSATSWNCHYRETLVLCQSCPPPLLTSPAVVCELIVILQEPPP